MSFTYFVLETLADTFNSKDAIFYIIVAALLLALFVALGIYFNNPHYFKNKKIKRDNIPLEDFQRIYIEDIHHES